MNLATYDLALRQLAMSGTGGVTTSTAGPLGWLLAMACGLRSGRERAVFDVSPGQPERWIRHFGRRRRTSRVHLDERGRLVERLGPLTLCFDVSCRSGGAFADLRRVGVGRVTVLAPSALSIACDVRTHSGRSRLRTTTVVVEIGPRRAASSRLASLTYTADLEVSR